MHQTTPVLFNHHTPIEINASTIYSVNLNKVASSRDPIKNKERVLILTPLRDAARYLPKYFELIAQLSYPHNLIDLAFLVSDSEDGTLSALALELDRVQNNPDPKLDGPFHSVTIVEKDFGLVGASQEVSTRHEFKQQAPRRKAMAKARNFLLTAALKPEHSWVFWRDSDVVESPKSIIQDFAKFDKDVIVPSTLIPPPVFSRMLMCADIWFHRYDDNGKDIEGRFDYNSWQESPEGLALAASLPKDEVLVEGYAEYHTRRKYMATMGHRGDNVNEIIPLDGIGGVSILVKADVHRAGTSHPIPTSPMDPAK